MRFASLIVFVMIALVSPFTAMSVADEHATDCCCEAHQSGGFETSECCMTESGQCAETCHTCLCPTAWMVSLREIPVATALVGIQMFSEKPNTPITRFEHPESPPPRLA